MIRTGQKLSGLVRNFQDWSAKSRLGRNDQDRSGMISKLKAFKISLAFKTLFDIVFICLPLINLRSYAQILCLLSNNRLISTASLSTCNDCQISHKLIQLLNIIRIYRNWQNLVGSIAVKQLDTLIQLFSLIHNSNSCLGFGPKQGPNLPFDHHHS